MQLNMLPVVATTVPFWHTNTEGIHMEHALAFETGLNSWIYNSRAIARLSGSLDENGPFCVQHF